MDSKHRAGPRYRVDDKVLFSASNAPARGQRSPDRYTVVAVLPIDLAGQYHYRIQPAGPGPNRVAAELELRR